MRKELEKLELQQKNLRDNYNTLDPAINLNDAERVLNSNLRYAPQKHHTWETYAMELKTHVHYANEKNRKAHIEGKRPWYTHRSPLGCFMCEDIAIMNVMLQVIQSMAKQYPKQPF